MITLSAAAVTFKRSQCGSTRSCTWQCCPHGPYITGFGCPCGVLSQSWLASAILCEQSGEIEREGERERERVSVCLMSPFQRYHS